MAKEGEKAEAVEALQPVVESKCSSPGANQSGANQRAAEESPSPQQPAVQLRVTPGAFSGIFVTN